MYLSDEGILNSFQTILTRELNVQLVLKVAGSASYQGQAQ